MAEGLLWDERHQPRSLGDAWKAALEAPYSLRRFPTDPEVETIFHLPTELVTVVTAEEVEKYSLVPGDWVSKGTFGGIKAINGVPLNFWERLRGREADVPWDIRPNRRRRLLDFFGDPLANLLTALLPIPAGSCGFIEGERGTLKSDILWALMKTMALSGREVMFLLLERTGEIPLLEADTESHMPTVPEGVELWAITHRQRLTSRDFTMFADFAIAVAKARAISGKNVVLVVDSLKVLADCLDATIPDSGRALSGGLTRQALDRLGATYLAVAGDPPGEGSLTILGSFMLNPKDRGTMSLAEVAEGTVDIHYVCLPSEEARRVHFPVDLSTSMSRRLEWVIGKEKAEKIWAFQAHMAALESNHLGRLIEAERKKGPVSRDRQEGLHIEAERLAEKDWQKLLEAAASLSAEELWQEWPAIIGAKKVKKPERPEPTTEPVVEVAEDKEAAKVEAKPFVPPTFTREEIAAMTEAAFGVKPSGRRKNAKRKGGST